MYIRNNSIFVLFLALTTLVAGSAFSQGALTPPGAPASGMRSLDQIESRTPISQAGYVISQSGSYYLTGNIQGQVGTDGITVQANDVTIDLNGYTLDGMDAGSVGIKQNNEFEGLKILNGTVQNWQSDGIHLVNEGVVQDCNVLSNGDDGIESGTESLIRNCFVKGNVYGVYLNGATCELSGCRIIRNSREGVFVNSTEGYVHDNIVRENLKGLYASNSGNTFDNNMVQGNEDNYSFMAGNKLNLLLSEVPESLEWPCSVKFSGSILCLSNGVNGITVDADDVMIDMCGHSLIGPGSNSGHGIYQSAGSSRVHIMNGTVAGWKGPTYSGGAYLHGADALISNIKAFTNNYGIAALGGATVKNCNAQANSEDGIHVAGEALVVDCVSIGNGSVGISSLNEVVISGCVANNNTGNGIWTREHAVVTSCRMWGNMRNGIKSDQSAVVKECSSQDNDLYGFHMEGSAANLTRCDAGTNNLAGIYVEYASMVHGCKVSDSPVGILAGSDCMIVNNNCIVKGNSVGVRVTGSSNRVDGNCVTGNSSGDIGIDVDGSGNLIIRNTCTYNATNYDIVGGNSYDVETSLSGADPWDNFDF